MTSPETTSFAKEAVAFMTTVKDKLISHDQSISELDQRLRDLEALVLNDEDW